MKEKRYDLIDAYLDNNLTLVERAEVEALMKQDDFFRREVEAFREIHLHMRDMNRIRLRETLARIVHERERKYTILEHMRSLYLYYARGLGERPILVLVFFVAMSAMLIERLISYVSSSPRGVFGPHYSLPIMVALIIIVCGVLLWRLSVADRILRKMVLDKYREAVRLLDSNARATVRDLAGRLGIGKNFYVKFIRLITLTPGPFLLLIVFLAVMNITLHLMFNYFPYDPAGSIWEDVYVHTPWAIGMLVLLYLIHTDILIIDQLRHLVDSISVRKFADFFEHLEKFKGQLTEEELRVLDYYVLYPNLSSREIARRLMGLSDVEMVEQHRQSIIAKWNQYAAQNRLSVRLEKLLTVFYVEYPSRHIYNAGRRAASMN
jgi:hypothetical protein